jgi:hypothetical protein
LGSRVGLLAGDGIIEIILGALLVLTLFGIVRIEDFLLLIIAGYPILRLINAA